MTQSFRTNNAAVDDLSSPSLGVTDTQTPEYTDGNKESVMQVKDSAAQAGQQVAGTAKDQAREVVGETQRQTKNLLNQGRQEFSHQAAQQHQRATSGLRSIGDELHGMASNSPQSGIATDLTREGAQRAQALAGWLEQREPGDLLQEVKAFARQRPVTFLAIAAGAGILAGRLGRGIQADASGSHPDAPSGGLTPAEGTSPALSATDSHEAPGAQAGTSIYGPSDPMSDPADPSVDPPPGVSDTAGSAGILGAPAGTGQLPTGGYRGQGDAVGINLDQTATQAPEPHLGEHR